MSLGIAYCLSVLILLFFFGFMGYLSNWRSFVVQWGSVLLGVFVAGTAVNATLDHWPSPLLCGGAANWQLASWVGLSLMTTAVYWYDARTTTEEDVRGISSWSIFLLAVIGGWGGAFFSELFIVKGSIYFMNWVLLGLATLVNIVFWVWLMDQVSIF